MKYFLTLFLSGILLSATAQTETEIRKHYQEVNQQILESKEMGYEGPFYGTRVITNTTGKSWPAVGRFADTTDFWYDDPPDHLPVSERDPGKVLLKVNIHRVSSHLHIYEEYLFKNGVLLFYYSLQAEEGHGWETRVWFHSKGVLKTSTRVNELEITPADPEYADLVPDINFIRKNARELQESFVKMM